MKVSPLFAGSYLLLATMALHADKIRIYNDYNDPVYIALVQVVNGGKDLYKNMKITGATPGRVPIYAIQKKTGMDNAERPSWGEKTVLKDTELWYSTNLNNLKDAIRNNDIPSKTNLVKIDGGIGRIKIGQVGNKQWYIYEKFPKMHFTATQELSEQPTSLGLAITQPKKGLGDDKINYSAATIIDNVPLPQ